LDLGSDMVEALGALFPAAREAKVLKTLVTREHNALSGRPGSAQHRARPVPGLPGSQCGRWTATGWPDHGRGCRSGLAALAPCWRHRASRVLPGPICRAPC